MSASLLDRLDVDDVDFAADDLPELHATLARLRGDKPYAVVRYGPACAVLLLTHELVSAAFKDEQAFPAAAIYSITTEPVLGKTIQCMSGREHRVNRGIVSPPFRRKLVADYVTPLLAPLADELIDRFAAAGDVDLVSEFTTRYPVLVISRLLGLPISDEHAVRRWANDLFHYPFAPAAAKRASREFTDYVTPIIQQRRRHPGDDLISTLVTGAAEGEALTDEEVLAFLRLLFPAGADTTLLALGNTLAALLSRPDQLAMVRGDPDRHAEWAVWEGLRWEPPVGLLPRLCPDGASWHGIDIPPHTPVVFSVNAALRDPDVFADADTYDLTRQATTMLAFGQGPHACAGTWLAVAELTTALKTLVTRLPGLHLRPGAESDTRIKSQIGTALRGPDTLPVRWHR